jgi:hypothetical protein
VPALGEGEDDQAIVERVQVYVDREYSAQSYEGAVLGPDGRD